MRAIDNLIKKLEQFDETPIAKRDYNYLKTIINIVEDFWLLNQDPEFKIKNEFKIDKLAIVYDKLISETKIPMYDFVKDCKTPEIKMEDVSFLAEFEVTGVGNG